MGFINKIFCLIFINLVCLYTHSIYAQLIFHQDIFHGGVTGAGFSTGLGTGNGDVAIYIEPNSIITKAYLFAFSSGHNTSGSIYVNNIEYRFSTQNKLTAFTHTNSNFTPIGLHVIDITNDIDSSVLNYNFEIPIQENMPTKGVFAPYLYIVYENILLPLVSSTIILNNKNLTGNEFYSINNLNYIDTSKSVGFSIYTDRTGSGLVKNEDVWINNNYIGRIGGSDQVNNLWSGAGVKGHFYYQHDSLFGLDDDIPNTVMDSTDGIADIRNYFVSSLTSFNFQLRNILFPNQSFAATSIKLSYFLTHSTPCDTFSVDIPNDPQVCKGDSIQLNVTGGNEWEWEPAIGLSCTNCPNPYFTDTVSRWYTLRVWNNDSCSKVLPVRVEVVPKPLNPIVQTSPTKCSDSSGVATVQLIASSYLYAIDNGAFQSNAVFSQLSAGNHNISVVDTNGCVAETNFSISETFPMANFTASPLEGDVPLEVNFTNQSTGATDFIWYIANDTLYSTNPNYTFEEEGNFNVTLVAYDTYLNCSDTASVQIFATFPFTVIAPSLFVKQDSPYQIYTSNVASLSYVLYNSIGQQIYNTSFAPTQGINDVWYPYNISRGIYLYRITAKDDEGNEKVFSGKIVVI